ncbi:hypothetical protein [Pararhizobium sp.]|uniref:hypothetical protein n=1 Tax=Pararhizobium sp. TaxID=1977563 RepID=UPI0027269070|nr:hypothetical protein [Pararhizobium sp.]MDO9417364.1 hypothetical protein [Pararhizobium sp.]
MGVCETKSAAKSAPNSGVTRRSFSLSEFSNPFGDDVEGDAEFIVTGRKLNRIVVLAAKAADRFAQAGIDIDPLVWMHLPSECLEGLYPIEACLELKHFEAAMVFEEGRCNYTSPAIAEDVACTISKNICRQSEFSRSSDKTPITAAKRLYTATIVDMVGSQYLHVFYATIAKNILQVAEGLRHHFGKQTADLAIIRRGFDPSDPIVLSLVSDALADMLVMVDADPWSPLAAGLNIQFQARFDA